MFSTHASEKIYKYVCGMYANDNFYIINNSITVIIKIYKNHELQNLFINFK